MTTITAIAIRKMRAFFLSNRYGFFLNVLSVWLDVLFFSDIIKPPFYNSALLTKQWIDHALAQPIHCPLYFQRFKQDPHDPEAYAKVFVSIIVKYNLAAFRINSTGAFSFALWLYFESPGPTITVSIPMRRRNVPSVVPFCPRRPIGMSKRS